MLIPNEYGLCESRFRDHLWLAASYVRELTKCAHVRVQMCVLGERCNSCVNTVLLGASTHVCVGWMWCGVAKYSMKIQHELVAPVRRIVVLMDPGRACKIRISSPAVYYSTSVVCAPTTSILY